MKRSPFKHLMQLLSPWRGSHDIENLASDIARQSRIHVTKQLLCQAKFLPYDQMKGYIRAYATLYLSSIIKQHNDITHLNTSQVAKVVLKAKEYLIEMVVRDLQSMPPIVMADIAAAA
jgi:hypothetical protein